MPGSEFIVQSKDAHGSVSQWFGFVAN